MHCTDIFDFRNCCDIRYHIVPESADQNLENYTINRPSHRSWTRFTSNTMQAHGKGMLVNDFDDVQFNYHTGSVLIDASKSIACFVYSPIRLC